MRYFIRLSYNGTGFCGWQIQPNSITVQESLERALSLALGTGIKVTGIALLTNRSKSTIVSARKSMYKKVFHQDGKPEEWDDFIRKF